MNWGTPSPLQAGAWWGVAEADATIIGLVVAVLVVFAIAYVVQRLRRAKDEER